jgi:hypothetical protein
VPTDTRPDRQRHFQDREKAAEAGRRGAAALAERRRTEAAALEALPEGDEGAALLGMPAAGEAASRQDRAIVRRLEQDAAKGDVAAARELREWRRRDPAREAGADALRLALLVSRLSTVQRRALFDWVTDALREQESPAQQDNREGSNEGDEAVPSAREEEQEADPHPPEPRDSDAARGTEPSDR